MKLLIAFPAALAALFVSSNLSLAAVPPAPAQAVAAAQGAPTPNAGIPAGGYTYTYSGPANPAVLPASPTTGRADAAHSRWSDDRWWYYTPDSRWLVYGQNGWSNPAAQRRPNAASIPSGYQYPAIGSKFYTYPRFGNYYPSRFPANNPGIFSGTR